MRALILPLAVITLLLGPPLGASDDPRPAASDPPVLQGPAVTASAAPATILVRSFDGRVTPVEGEPEAAALRALPLDAKQRDALDGVMARRIAFFDELVRTNLLELEQGAAALGRLEHAKSASERWSAIATFASAWKAFGPWRDRGSVIDEVATEFPESLRHQAQRMAAQYRAALAAERAADLGLPVTHGQVQAHVRLEAFAALVQASFERQQRSGEQDLERLAREVGLTPEQTERARAIFMDLALKELRHEAKGWDRFATLSAFMRELTPEQRVRAWRAIRRDAQ
jgi:hypothetical protein